MWDRPRLGQFPWCGMRSSDIFRHKAMQLRCLCGIPKTGVWAQFTLLGAVSEPRGHGRPPRAPSHNAPSRPGDEIRPVAVHSGLSFRNFPSGMKLNPSPERIRRLGSRPLLSRSRNSVVYTSCTPSIRHSAHYLNALFEHYPIRYAVFQTMPRSCLVPFSAL